MVTLEEKTAEVSGNFQAFEEKLSTINTVHASNKRNGHRTPSLHTARISRKHATSYMHDS